MVFQVFPKELFESADVPAFVGWVFAVAEQERITGACPWLLFRIHHVVVLGIRAACDEKGASAIRCDSSCFCHMLRKECFLLPAVGMALDKLAVEHAGLPHPTQALAE